MNYSVSVYNPHINMRVEVVVPTLQIAAGIVTHNAPKGWEITIKMEPKRNYTHRNSAYVQSYLDVEMFQLVKHKKLEAVA